MKKITRTQALKHRVTSNSSIRPKSLYDYLAKQNRIEMSYEDFLFILTRINELFVEYAIDSELVTVPYIFSLVAVEQKCEFVFNRETINRFATTYPIDIEETRRLKDKGIDELAYDTDAKTILRLKLYFRAIRNIKFYLFRFHNSVTKKLKQYVTY